MKKILNAAFYIILICYVILTLLLFFRLNSLNYVDLHGVRSVNLIPFDSIWGYIFGNIADSLSDAIRNILGNIVVFIPYGLYIQVFRKNKQFSKSFLQIVITTLAIEIIQFAFNLGAADIDDIILNCIGGVIGILFYKLLRMRLKDDEKTKEFISVLSLVIGLPIVCWLLYIIIRFRVAFNIQPK